MKPDVIAAISDKIMSNHVLEIALDEEHLLVQAFDEMITESDVTQR
jgi:hypothetical protein